MGTSANAETIRRLVDNADKTYGTFAVVIGLLFHALMYAPQPALMAALAEALAALTPKETKHAV